MSAQNPFQIPSCFKLDIEYRRRERFKKTVVTALIVSVVLVVGLLIEGCVNEKSSQFSWPQRQASTPASTPAPATKIAPAQQPQPAFSKTTVPLQSCPVAMVPPNTAAPVPTSHTTGGAVYLVKSGDTLTFIAKTHGITVKAIKSANNLATDRIVVGEKLRIPTA